MIQRKRTRPIPAVPPTNNATGLKGSFVSELAALAAARFGMGVLIKETLDVDPYKSVLGGGGGGDAESREDVRVSHASVTRHGDSKVP